MPGMVVFRRRWSVGSDDLVVPGAFLFTVHLIWTIILGVLLCLVHFDRGVECILLLWCLILGYLAVLVLSMAVELCICVVAMRGSILDTDQRSSMQYILYLRLTVMIIEAGWLSAGVAWLITYYIDCQIDKAKETVLGMVVFNICILFSVVMTVWCTYDTAGRSWVKMKQYQRSMRESESKFQYKRSGSTRNWRQRKVLRAYQDSWHNRCRFLFCCSTASDRNRNSFADIARLLADYFRDLDVVPSDVVVGLVLLRKFQKIERKAIVEQRKNDTYEFLSGAPITPRTQFLSLLEDGSDLDEFQAVIHFAHYAVRAYGWPVYVMTNKCGLCQLCAGLNCCCIPCRKTNYSAEIVDDNCCQCNYAALHKLTDVGDIEIIYATYHVDVGQTPFFVAIDYDRKKIIISIRGTLSMKDILTDLNAEGETLPLNPPQEEWLGHKGMVQAAQYILEKLDEENLVERAMNHRIDRGTSEYELVIVGHSLGAGTASILGILLRQRHPTLLCYCYAPPGGLLSAPAVEYTKEFTVSVVVGKDVVPRIGLHQMETLRTDLINAIKRSVDPKWKTITCSIVCCGCSQPTSAVEMSSCERDVSEYMRSKEHARCVGIHPSDSSIALTSHQPLYPPGRIVHVVRQHPTTGQQALSKNEPVYQALWAANTDFDEVLISPVMIQDHMPDKLLEALNKVVTTLGPKKPQRTPTTSEPSGPYFTATNSNQNLFLETSFTSLQSPGSNASSVTNGYYSTKSQPSSLCLTPNLSQNQDVYNANNNFDTKKTLLSPLIDKTQTKTKDLESIETIYATKSSSTVFNQLAPFIPSHKPLTKSFSLSLKRTTSPCVKIDLIHDDWFGLAPLASPESLSELSSISSRTSLVTTSVVVEINTPKIMRRTPKIIGSLSTCADDIRNVRNFQKCKTFTRLFINNNTESSSSSNLSYESASSSNKCCSNTESSYKTESNCCGDDCENSDSEFQSAEDILDNVLASAGCKEFFNSESNFLETHFDLFQERQCDTSPSSYKPPSDIYTQALSPHSPHDDDPDILSNLAIDLSLDEEHRSSIYQQSKTSSSVDSGSVCRTPSDITKNVTFNPQVVTVSTISCDDMPPSPIKWRNLFRSRNPHKQRVDPPKLPPLPPVTGPIVSILSTKNKYSNEDRPAEEDRLQKNRDEEDVYFKHSDRSSEDSSVKSDVLLRLSDSGRDAFLRAGDCFSRTEQLPLLSNLNSGASDRTSASPNLLRRKKYVYPSDVVVMTTHPNESAV